MKGALTIKLAGIIKPNHKADTIALLMETRASFNNKKDFWFQRLRALNPDTKDYQKTAGEYSQQMADLTNKINLTDDCIAWINSH